MKGEKGECERGSLLVRNIHAFERIVGGRKE